jgi:predicted tellurium resistance membrane protein TerC
MNWLTDPQVWMALVTLTALEIVLGIDNIIFISIQAGKLPAAKQEKARLIGLGLAMFIRIALLFSLTWLMGLTAPLFSVLGNEISGRDLILLSGGLFLLWKSTMEIHEKLEGDEGVAPTRVGTTFGAVIVQILLLDIVFSLDSIITALGMANQLAVMIAAVVIAVGFMMLFSGKISAFVEKHPTIKMLALSFLLLIGVALIGDGLDMHIPKGYIYFAMAFSVMVEMLNLRMRRGTPVKLHQPYLEESGTEKQGVTDA